MSFERECEMSGVYEGVQVGTRRVDFFEGREEMGPWLLTA